MLPGTESSDQFNFLENEPLCCSCLVKLYLLARSAQATLVSVCDQGQVVGPQQAESLACVRAPPELNPVSDTPNLLQPVHPCSATQCICGINQSEISVTGSQSHHPGLQCMCLSQGSDTGQGCQARLGTLGVLLFKTISYINHNMYRNRSTHIQGGRWYF